MAGTVRRIALLRALGWACVIALVVGGALWYVGTYFDWVEKRVRTGMTGDALTNPYLAAERVLQTLGVDARHVSDARTVLDLPPTTTLFLPSPQVFDADQARRLAQWVESGGHLIVLIEDNSVLADALGVEMVGHRLPVGTKTPTLMQAHFDDRETALHAEVTFAHLLETDEPARWRLSVHGGRVRWNVGDDDEADADDDPIELLDSADAMLHYARGSGFVTAIGTTSMLENDEIGRHDHAELWVRLTLLAGPRAIVITREPQFPSLIAWLWERAPYVFIGFAVFLVVGLWYWMPRFGPLEPIPLPARPGLREHLGAVGEFHLKRRDFAALLSPLRDDCVRALTWRAARDGDSGSLAALAHQRSGLSMPEIDRALHGGVQSRAEFFHCAASLACIRDALAQSSSNNTHHVKK